MQSQARVWSLRTAGKVGAVVFAGFLAAVSASVGAVPVFVIGDAVLSEEEPEGTLVNFWGAQWWKNNPLTGEVGKGVASFKGYAGEIALDEEEPDPTDLCTGWSSRPGNSSNPPDALPEEIYVIVTNSVLKNGPVITGSAVAVLTVAWDTYGPNPGHPGYGRVTGFFSCLQ